MARSGSTSAGSGVTEELRHGLVQVEQDRDADEAQRQGREHEEVRQRVDLDEREPLAAVGLDRCPSGSDQERQVLAQVRPESCALVALDVEPPDVHAAPDFLGGLARAGAGRGRGPGVRSPTSDSASRRTRGSSS